MRTKQSWKQKVDPALADKIKVFLESLKLIEEPDIEDSKKFIEPIIDSAEAEKKVKNALWIRTD